MIDACWAGFVDLRRSPSVAHLPESRNLLPGLADALVRLIARARRSGPSKCDVWPADGVRPDEMDASRRRQVAMACYIDLLPRNDQQWPCLGSVRPVRATCRGFDAVSARCPARADLILCARAFAATGPETASRPISRPADRQPGRGNARRSTPRWRLCGHHLRMPPESTSKLQ